MGKRRQKNAGDAWAGALSSLTGISLADAQARVTRMRADARLMAALPQIAAALGPRVVVTNLEWTGPELDVLTVSTFPAPAAGQLAPEVAAKIPAAVRGLASEAQARAALRADVARFELGGVEFDSDNVLQRRGPSSALGMLVDQRLVKFGSRAEVQPVGPSAVVWRVR